MSVEGAAGSMRQRSDPYGEDIYTEPDGDADTMAHLGPLAPMAGVWEGLKGFDQHPVVGGDADDAFVERYELQPIDPQTNGPQLFYGLRYHTHIVRTGEIETFHDQVGYWLWESAAELITFSLCIPRGQVLLASGHAHPDATEFEVRATLGAPIYGILSNPFLDRAFTTLDFTMRVSITDSRTWSYEEVTTIKTPDRRDPFSHIDRNTLTRVAAPTPNPLAVPTD